VLPEQQALPVPRVQQRLSPVPVLREPLPLPLRVLPQQRLVLPRPYHHWLIVLTLHWL
jgi:hypothetical protein